MLPDLLAGDAGNKNVADGKLASADGNIADVAGKRKPRRPQGKRIKIMD